MKRCWSTVIKPPLGGSIFWAVLLCLVLAPPAFAQKSALESISLDTVRTTWPAAAALGEVLKDPPVRELYSTEGLIGYAHLSDEIKPIPAYSGRPVRILVALDLQGVIRGTRILSHEEPILVIGIDDSMLARFVDQFQDRAATARVRINAYNRSGYVGIDGITGATITAMVMNSSIMQSAKLVADAMQLPRPGTTPVIKASDPSLDEEIPQWMSLWQEQTVELVLLTLALTLLMGILFFQDWLVVHPTLFNRVRVGYLLFTLGFLGFFCKAQLSVINLLAFMRILFGGFTWETLLIDPIIFVLWGFVAVSIILWGRGVFCGWLCPFGAAQELIHKVANRFELPTWEFPAMVHERLWAIKYFLLIALVGLSLESMSYAAMLAEIEPFKTVFVMRFNREIGFVAFALLLLVISVFNSKFYCKYLCPLGAGLSFFTRFRIFDWLRRRQECGEPCQSCATQCQISAIKPTGEIIDNECHYCLECQVTYWDDQRCPPLVDKRKRHEKRQRKQQTLIGTDKATG
jgi:polyferredoxin/Na+-translocating ferredoxin:NAD+ oxidoreductase RnfG subunit